MEIVPGYDLYMSYGRNHSALGFFMPISISNDGAKDVMVRTIEGTLAKTGDDWSAPVYWDSFVNPDSVEKPGARPFFRFASWACPLVVSSRKALTTWICFAVDPIPGRLPEGQYILKLHLVVGATPKELPSWTGSFSVKDAEITFLETSCVADANDWAPDSQPFRVNEGPSGVPKEPIPHFLLQESNQDSSDAPEN
jgi:hypothetical protein